MGENKLMIPAAVLLACFVLWGIFFTSRTRVQKENNLQETEEKVPKSYRDNYRSDSDYPNDLENRHNDFDYFQDFDSEYINGNNAILEIPEFEIPEENIDGDFGQTVSSLQQKVDNCLLIEEQRYRNVTNTYLNPDSLYYVGNFNFLEAWENYEKEHEKEKEKCYQLYLQ